MKVLIAFLLVIISASTLAADRYWKDIPFTGVVDGDTIQTKIATLPYPLYNVKIRILGIDTPEKGYLAKCEREKQLGVEATAKLTELIGTSSVITLKNFKYDKYGGRLVSEVIVNGINLGQKMLEHGYARVYSGTGPKPDWCQ